MFISTIFTTSWSPHRPAAAVVWGAYSTFAYLVDFPYFCIFSVFLEKQKLFKSKPKSKLYEVCFNTDEMSHEKTGAFEKTLISSYHDPLGYHNIQPHGAAGLG